MCPALKRGRDGHNSLEIRRGVRAKLTVVGRGELRNISLCEARYVAPPPPIPDNYCIVSHVQLYEPMKLVSELTV